MKNLKVNRKGFTLIELIIVIAIISILAAAIFVAIDPARRLHESRNARRWSDVTNILDATIKYQADNGGTHYSTVAGMTDDLYYVIGTCAAAATCTAQVNQAACIDLSAIGSNYLANIPVDPSAGTAADTDYYIMQDANGAIAVGACEPEGEGAGGSGDAPAIELVR